MSDTRVIALVGSLRADSVNRRLAEATVGVAPDGVEVTVFDGLADLPFYNEDIDVPGTIEAVDKLRESVASSNAVLLITPEYNGTIPAVLKNAIDWLSRPYGDGAFTGKPTAVISASPSGNAAKWAHADTVKAAGIAGAKVLENVELSIGGTTDKFGDAHPREHAEVAGQLAGIVSALAVASAEIAA